MGQKGGMTIIKETNRPRTFPEMGKKRVDLGHGSDKFSGSFPNEKEKRSPSSRTDRNPCKGGRIKRVNLREIRGEPDKEPFL